MTNKIEKIKELRNLVFEMTTSDFQGYCEVLAQELGTDEDNLISYAYQDIEIEDICF